MGGAPPAPESTGGGVGAWQMPWVEPGGITHEVPTQQSAVVVHEPPVWTHEVAPHTKAGWPPAGFGTHGVLQQSADEAQAVPAGGGPFAAQS